MHKPSLTIFGDSWSCGEWDTPNGNADSYQVVHPGLTEYFADYFSVKNYSDGGASLWQCVTMLDRFFDYERSLPREQYCLVFQTSADRCREAEKYSVDIVDIIRKTKTVEQFYSTLLEIWYMKLNNVATKYSKKIFLVGGLTDLQLDLLSDFTNLVPMCVSWQQLLYPTHELSAVPLVPDSRLLDLVKENKNLDLMQSIINHYDDRFLAYNNMRSLSTIGPIDFHPNRLGHEIMANYITKIFKGEVNVSKS